MVIYTAHWKHYTDDYYAPHNRKMFTTRELADTFLTDLMNYEHIERYYVLEEDVYEEYIPSNDYSNEYDDELYYDDADEFYSDPLEMHYSELAWYKQEEMDNMYNTCNHFTRGLGQSVINLDSYWFTSDETEAFREIWQRRLSA